MEAQLLTEKLARANKHIAALLKICEDSGVSVDSVMLLEAGRDWTNDKPTKPGIYLIAAEPNTTPSLVSVRVDHKQELVLVDEPEGTDSLDDLQSLHECHLWCGPISRPHIPNTQIADRKDSNGN